MKKLPMFILLFYFSELASSASFDCDKARTSVEKMICGSKQLSHLDVELSRIYKERIGQISQPEEFRGEQKKWLAAKRNKCSTAECLREEYILRITDIKKRDSIVMGNKEKKNLIKKKNFKLTKNLVFSSSVCSEYLDLLNRAEWNDLQACKLVDLRDSNLKQPIVTPVDGDNLAKLDSAIVKISEGYSYREWLKVWPTRKKEYSLNYRKLGFFYIDLDGDGDKDRILEEQHSWEYCMERGSGDYEKEGKLNQKKWAAMGMMDKVKTSRKYGYRRDYYLEKEGALVHVDADSIIEHGGKYFSISHSGLRNKNTSTDWGSKNWVRLSVVKNYIDDVSGRFDTAERCFFWLN